MQSYSTTHNCQRVVPKSNPEPHTAEKSVLLSPEQVKPFPKTGERRENKKCRKLRTVISQKLYVTQN